MVMKASGSLSGVRKMKRRTKGWLGVKKNSQMPISVEMVPQEEGGASGKIKDSPKPSPKPNLLDPLRPRKSDLATGKKMQSLYERWRSFHKIHRTPDEMLERFPTFIENAIRIYKYNEEKQSFSLCLSRWSDKTSEERRAPPLILPMRVKKRDLVTGKAMRSLYKRWRSYHSIRRTPDEKLERFPTFKENVIDIYKNYQQDKSYSKYLGRWADSTEEERIAHSSSDY